MTHDGRPVVIGAVPDPRAWLGREHERPQALVDAGHFAAFDEARQSGAWKAGSWAPTVEALRLR